MRHIHSIIGIILCTTILGVLSSCEADSAPDVSTDEMHELRVSMSSQRFGDAAGSATRGILPEDFEEYASQTPVSQIQAYLTYLEEGSERSYVSTVFGHQTSGAGSDIWTSRVPLKSGDYYLYGFMPKDGVGSSVSIAPYNDGNGAAYSKGAVLTLAGLNAVTPDDICVIVGAEGYGGPDKPVLPNMSGRLGNFLYNTSDGDNLYLLIDHLYAGLQFNLKLGETYRKLRKIRLNSISLEPDNSKGEAVATVKAVVTIVNNNDGQNPIIQIPTGGGNFKGGKVEFAVENTGDQPKPAVLYRGDNLWLTATEQPFLACFCPSTNTNFVLETNYNVYDLSDRLIRENQTARNRIKLQWNLTSGQIHTINITVNPTYLYVLSEPDLDNPTFDVN